MRKFNKEIISIISGIALAYAWQLFFILMCNVLNPGGNFITGDMFIPISSIQIAIVPIASWILMGLLHVSWFKKWIRITLCGMALFIPFTLITAITIIVAPFLWWNTLYWIVNVICTILISFTLFKPLLYLSYSIEEQAQSEDNRKS